MYKFKIMFLIVGVALLSNAPERPPERKRIKLDLEKVSYTRKCMYKIYCNFISPTNFDFISETTSQIQ